MMNCKECGGRVTIDRAYSSDRRLELTCLRCGKDWMLTDVTNALYKWLVRKEYALVGKVNGA